MELGAGDIFMLAARASGCAFCIKLPIAASMNNHTRAMRPIYIQFICVAAPPRALAPVAHIVWQKA